MSTDKEEKTTLLDDSELNAASGGAVVPPKAEVKPYRVVKVGSSDQRAAAILNGKSPNVNCKGTSLTNRGRLGYAKRLNYGECSACRTKWSVIHFLFLP